MLIFLVLFLLSDTTNLSCTSENCVPVVRNGVVVPSTFHSDRLSGESVFLLMNRLPLKKVNHKRSKTRTPVIVPKHDTFEEQTVVFDSFIYHQNKTTNM